MEDIKKRVVEEFITQVQIDSLSLQEAKMFEYLKKRLKKMPVEMDFQEYKLEEIGAKSGNMIVKLPANTSEEHKSLFFDAHLDTVEPGIGIKPVVKGDIIRSNGQTVLGADDKAASAAMVIAIEEIINSKIEHGDLYFIFTSAEEIGLMGVNHLDFSNIKADFGYVLDSHGSVGGVIVSAPFHYQYEIKVKGRASHAGIAPEKGVNAIKITAKIITELPQGRISADTVANIGMIEGGKATNIIADECTVKGEYRSLDFNDIKTLYQKVQMTIDKYKGEALGIEITQTEAYKGFDYESSDEIIKLVDKALKAIDIEPRHEKTGGGSNTNIYNQNGIKALTLAIGMMNVHSKDEYINTQDLVNITRLIVKLATIA